MAAAMISTMRLCFSSITDEASCMPKISAAK